MLFIFRLHQIFYINVDIYTLISFIISFRDSYFCCQTTLSFSLRKKYTILVLICSNNKFLFQFKLMPSMFLGSSLYCLCLQLFYKGCLFINVVFKAYLTQDTRLRRLSSHVNRTYNQTNRGLTRVTLRPLGCICVSRTSCLKQKKRYGLSHARPCEIESNIWSSTLEIQSFTASYNLLRPLCLYKAHV